MMTVLLIDGTVEEKGFLMGRSGIAQVSSNVGDLSVSAGPFETNGIGMTSYDRFTAQGGTVRFVSGYVGDAVEIEIALNWSAEPESVTVTRAGKDATELVHIKDFEGGHVAVQETVAGGHDLTHRSRDTKAFVGWWFPHQGIGTSTTTIIPPHGDAERSSHLGGQEGAPTFIAGGEDGSWIFEIERIALAGWEDWPVLWGMSVPDLFIPDSSQDAT